MGAAAIVNVLTGKVNPSGKLPVTVARHVGQIPIYYNHPSGSSWHQEGSIGFENYVDMPHTPRYYFGHGLSYTTFSYSDLQLSANEVTADGEIIVRDRNCPTVYQRLSGKHCQASNGTCRIPAYNIRA